MVTMVTMDYGNLVTYMVMLPVMAPVAAKKWSFFIKLSPNTLLREFMKMKSHLETEIMQK